MFSTHQQYLHFQQQQPPLPLQIQHPQHPQHPQHAQQQMNMFSQNPRNRTGSSNPFDSMDNALHPSQQSHHPHFLADPAILQISNPSSKPHSNIHTPNLPQYIERHPHYEQHISPSMSPIPSLYTSHPLHTQITEEQLYQLQQYNQMSHQIGSRFMPSHDLEQSTRLLLNRDTDAPFFTQNAHLQQPLPQHHQHQQQTQQQQQMFQNSQQQHHLYQQQQQHEQTQQKEPNTQNHIRD